MLKPIPSFPFLVKISQFKLLVMTEKNIFVYKLSCCKIFHILVYFLCKNCNPPKKSHPLFPSNPPLKIEILSSPPFFENLVVGSTSPAERNGGGGGGGAAHIMSIQVKQWKNFSAGIKWFLKYRK